MYKIGMYLGPTKIDITIDTKAMSPCLLSMYLGLGEVDVDRGEGAERAEQDEQQPRREEAKLDAPRQTTPRVPSDEIESLK